MNFLRHDHRAPLVLTFTNDEWCLQIQLERVLDVDEVEGEETRLLVKWVGAPYSACTYELVKDLEHAGQVSTHTQKHAFSFL